jgi:hypothetical protein
MHSMYMMMGGGKKPFGRRVRMCEWACLLTEKGTFDMKVDYQSSSAPSGEPACADPVLGL